MRHRKAVINFYRHVLIGAEGDKLIAADLGRVKPSVKTSNALEEGQQPTVEIQKPVLQLYLLWL